MDDAKRRGLAPCKGLSRRMPPLNLSEARLESLNNHSQRLFLFETLLKQFLGPTASSASKRVLSAAKSASSSAANGSTSTWKDSQSTQTLGTEEWIPNWRCFLAVGMRGMGAEYVVDAETMKYS